jgi:ribosomal protein S8E
MKTYQKLHRKSAGRRPDKPKDSRRQYRAGRESKAYSLPPQLTTHQKGAHR